MKSISRCSFKPSYLMSLWCFIFVVFQSVALAESDTLVVVSAAGPNSLDIQRSGTNRPSYQVAVNMYDRLVTFGVSKEADGGYKYNSTEIKPELATHWESVDNGNAMIFHLRKDATFWDGAPVTAHDVKWSFDRAVSLGGFPSVQMKAGSLEKPEQFEVVDEHTFKIKLIRKSKLTLPDLAVPVPIVFNSKLAKKHATQSDPWATEYLHKTPAGSGAYMLEKWEPGQYLIYKRFDNWKSGPLPAMKRVIVRDVPSGATRRALIERGDVDVSLDMPAKDAKELASLNKLNVVGSTIDNSMHAVGLNLDFEPFKNKWVRQAVAYAIPYEQIFEVVAYGRGVPMWGGKAKPENIDWPQPFPYYTDYKKAKALLKKAGYEQGFEVPLSINLGLAQWTEPAALLIQEGLGKIGIKAKINKIPGASWRTKALVEKGLELHLKNFAGWLNYPDYYYYWVYQFGHLFNSMKYQNKELESLISETLHMETSEKRYTKNIKRMLEIAYDDAPLIPLWQPTLDVAMSKNVEGYVNWFHRQLDIRSFKKK